MMRRHECHAEGCHTPCHPSRLMCLPHWKAVPKDLQDRVLKTYQAGQEAGQSTPSQAWHLAADAAIISVALQERRPSRATMGFFAFLPDEQLTQVYDQLRLTFPPSADRLTKQRQAIQELAGAGRLLELMQVVLTVYRAHP